MTVVLLGNSRQFQGVSGDSKPTSGVPAGSVFDELDTGRRFFYDGSAWQAQPGSGGVLAAGEAHVGAVGGHIAVPTANFARPNTTPTYASGQLVANNASAGSVVPLTLTVARVAAGTFMIRRVRLKKSSTGLTGASFRVHFYKTTAPTPSNGDTGAWLTDQAANYLGAFDVTMDKAFTDGAHGSGTPNTGSEINVALASGTDIYALIEARGAYVGVANETFILAAEVLQN